ncbi:DUF2304 domain-containing protein [uncultured Rothia sp.]|uniref:DUF2304 domain-containing protein n=1 Tax=uncultured Rothia sp. TaxID=316088 RepID=UPI0032170EFE
MVANLFFLILTLILVVMVLTQVRNQKMKEKYAALWLIISFLIIILVVFPKLLDWLADLVGIETPVNLLFLLAIIMLIGVSLHLTKELSKLGEDTRILAEKAAINDLLHEQLSRRVSELEGSRENRDSRK